MTRYESFLVKKKLNTPQVGFDISVDAIKPTLFPFQRDSVRWALRMGKASLFHECGLGKSAQELEWAYQVTQYTGKPVLILSPLAAALQMANVEVPKFGYHAKYARNQAEAGKVPIIITNYERVTDFDISWFGGVVLDESSILKAFTGKTKRQLIRLFEDTPFKLCASATPAPNDHVELGNHAEFLNVLPANDMLARWFINDTQKAGVYRLKGHAEDDFYRWLTSWAICLAKPSDLGAEYDIEGYTLPPLNIHEHLVTMNDASIERMFQQGRLIAEGNPSSMQLGRVKRETMQERIAYTKELVEQIPENESIVLWCFLNDEEDALRNAFPEAVAVRGSHSVEQKAERLQAFSNGNVRMIITKPEIAGLGLNWQHSNQSVFVSATYSFEKFYQAVRRQYRYGQTKPVDAHLVYSDAEGNVVATLQRKQADFKKMQDGAVNAIQKYGLFRDDVNYQRRSSVGTVKMNIPSWVKGE